MKAKRAPLALALLAGNLLAESPADLARLHLGQSATRAIANFRAADTIQERLARQGMTLHPQLIASRLRIEAALDEAQAALDKGAIEKATRALKRADGLLDRYARQIGGA